MTVGDPYSRDAAVDARSRRVAIPLRGAPAPLGGPAAQRYRRNWLGPVVGQAGTTMATEALKVVAGFGEPLLGRVLVVDAAKQRADVLTFAPWG